MDVYYKDANQPARFGGVEALYRALKGKVSREEIKKWFRGVDTYTLHKPNRKEFQTNRVIVYSIDHHWQAYLADLSTLKHMKS